MPQIKNEKTIFSVKEIANILREVIESEPFLNIWISGEISNPKLSQGHLFFSLKQMDEKGVYLLRAAMWKSNVQKLSAVLKEGDGVLCHGKLNFYHPSGEIKFIADTIEFEGIGDFWHQFQLMKEKLQEEGLFDIGHKKQIPLYPKGIGIITAKTGAALRDMLHILDTKSPQTPVYIFPTAVQGEGAAENIVKMIEGINSLYKNYIDVLILGRGGGSIEDLWCFNEENVARAIYESDLPIVTGIGHEVDFTIADFVADVRAPTPTRAADLVVRDNSEIANELEQYKSAIDRLLSYKINALREKLQIPSLMQRLSSSTERILDYHILQNKSISDQLITAMDTRIQKIRNDLDLKMLELKAFSSEEILKKGYALVVDENEKIIKRKSNIKGDTAAINFYDGKQQILFKK